MTTESDDAMAAIRRRMLEDTIAVRREIMGSVEMWSLESLAQRRHQSLAQTQAWIAELRARGAIIEIDHERRVHYPAFQFEGDGTKPIVRQIIDLLSPTYNDWDVMCWMTSATGWLSGSSPLDELDRNPSAVLKAAEQELMD